MTEKKKERLKKNAHKIADMFREDVGKALSGILGTMVKRNPAAINCIVEMQVFALTVLTDLYLDGKITIKEKK